MIRKLFVLLLNVSLASSFALAQVPDKARVVAGAERAFDKAAKAVTMPAPGCAVGVSVNGESVFEKAFGLAEMEHNIPNTPQTIFESGSVAKQFTAAALVLLQQDGKLSIDDPVRKYIPELPDYGAPLTIRHLLNHTAGLRDWGSVMALTGAGRGDRVVTQAIALDVIYRQRNLDYKPGDEYSYSNSGYQLAAEIVERVSKQKFADFLAERLLKPLGMTKTSVRDDYRRIVPGRAQAYSKQGTEPWRLNMPIMNVYGNGGMLTTVGDWLKWNLMLDSRSMGGTLVDALETRGVLNDGRKQPYALGLVNTTYKGIRDISHGGSTAGYQTFLARYPDHKLSVAVLCNGTAPNAGGLAASITDEILGPFPAPPPPPESISMTEDQLRKYVGLWRDEKTRAPARTVLQNGSLRFGGIALRPMADGKFLGGPASYTFVLGNDGNPVAVEGNDEGGKFRFIAEREWKPSADELAAVAGNWFSEEAQATLGVAVEGDRAFVAIRPVARFALTPLYKDHFTAAGYVFWFTRDASGKIDTMHVGTARMRDMPFVRVK